MAKSPGWTRVKKTPKKARWKKGKSYFKGPQKRMKKKTKRQINNFFIYAILFFIVFVILASVALY